MTTLPPTQNPAPGNANTAATAGPFQVLPASVSQSNLNYGAQQGVVVGNSNRVFNVFVNSAAEALTLLEDYRQQPDSIPPDKCVPLPTVVCRLKPAASAADLWDLTLLWNVLPNSETAREVRNPIDENCRRWIDEFRSLAWTAQSDPRQQQRLKVVAANIGEKLATVFESAEQQRLLELGHAEGDVPFLIIESTDDDILGLPWELLRFNDQFPVHDSRLDIARCVPNPHTIQRQPPTRPVKIRVNVCAPQGDGIPPLNYEEECFLISQAVDAQAATFNEMGEVEDLIDVVTSPHPPDVIHYSGHGSQGVLHFENPFGEDVKVCVRELVRRIRTVGSNPSSGRLPALFYLASCFGQNPKETATGPAGPPTSTAAILHYEGFAQIVAHSGPVYDRQATAAAASFYQALGEGRTARNAVRMARESLRMPFSGSERDVTRDAGQPAPDFSGETPFAWAMLVLYHRGPDLPLGTPAERTGGLKAVRREPQSSPDGVTTKMLQAGFVGRRRELHQLRRRLGYRSEDTLQPVSVVYGLGGVGKSVFCGKALNLFEGLGFQPQTIWCGEAERLTFLSQQQLPETDTATGGEATAGAWLARQVLQFLLPLVPVDQKLPSIPQLEQALRTWMATPGLPRIVVYLDNLESLMLRPDQEPATAHASMPWRDPFVSRVWKLLTAAAGKAASRLRILASSRYAPADSPNGHLLPLPALSAAEIFRMSGWYPSLRRLSTFNRARLNSLVNGHGRAMEFLDGLVGQKFDEYEHNYSAPPPPATSQQHQQQWDTFVDSCVADLHGAISEDLLFERLWNNVLSPAQQRLLVRLTVMFQPTDFSTISSLLDTECQESDFRRLNHLSLLEITDHATPRRFHTHPLIDQLVHANAGVVWQQQRQLAAERLAATFEGRFQQTQSVADIYSAGRYFFMAGDLDKAGDYLGGLAEHLASRGQVSVARNVIEPLVAAEATNQIPGMKGVEVRGILARIAMLAGQVSEAEALLLRAIEQARGVTVSVDAGRLAQIQSILLNDLGDIRSAQGNLPGAEQAYNDSLKIRHALAAQDPHNAQWQRDLSVSYNKIGDIRSAQGNLPGAEQAYNEDLRIAEQLAAQDPHNSQWQRDLSVSYEKIGDIRRAQGNLPGAEQAYNEHLRIAEQLAAQDPHNAQWQRDLSVSYKKVAGIELQSGNVAEALKLLINALRINEQLVRLAPGNLQWLVDYISTLFGVGSLLSQSPETREHGTPLLQEAQRLAAALLNTEHGTTEQLQALAAAINNALTQFDTAKTVAGPGPNP